MAQSDAKFCFSPGPQKPDQAECPPQTVLYPVRPGYSRTSSWLYKYSSVKDRTHLSLRGGSYSLPEDQHQQLLQMLALDVKEGKDNYLVENKTEVFPLNMDVDWDDVEPRSLNDIMHVILAWQKIVRQTFAPAPFQGRVLVCETLPKYLDDHRVKTGMHLIWPEILVKKDTALDILQAVLDILDQTPRPAPLAPWKQVYGWGRVAPMTPCFLWPRFFYDPAFFTCHLLTLLPFLSSPPGGFGRDAPRQVLDPCVFLSNGLRVNYSLKAEKCGVCRGEKNKKCQTCRDTGKLTDRRFYRVTAVLDFDGGHLEDEEKRHGDVLYSLAQSSIRRPSGDQPTPVTHLTKRPFFKAVETSAKKTKADVAATAGGPAAESKESDLKKTPIDKSDQRFKEIQQILDRDPIYSGTLATKVTKIEYQRKAHHFFVSSNSHQCMNKSDMGIHRSNHVWFEMTPNGTTTAFAFFPAVHSTFFCRHVSEMLLQMLSKNSRRRSVLQTQVLFGGHQTRRPSA